MRMKKETGWTLYQCLFRDSLTHTPAGTWVEIGQEEIEAFKADMKMLATGYKIYEDEEIVLIVQSLRLKPSLSPLEEPIYCLHPMAIPKGAILWYKEEDQKDLP